MSKHRTPQWLCLKRKQPPLNPVHLPKFLAEKEKKDKAAGLLFMASLPKSRWIK